MKSFTHLPVDQGNYKAGDQWQRGEWSVVSASRQSAIGNRQSAIFCFDSRFLPAVEMTKKRESSAAGRVNRQSAVFCFDKLSPAERDKL
jgi:hypothetical protein